MFLMCVYIVICVYSYYVFIYVTCVYVSHMCLYSDVCV